MSNKIFVPAADGCIGSHPRGHWFTWTRKSKPLCYLKTPSGMYFGLETRDSGSRPNISVEISHYIDRKLELMSIYESEMGVLPFSPCDKTLKSTRSSRGFAGGV